MTYIRTGRFDYRLEVDDPVLLYRALHDVYATMIGYAEKVRGEPRCSEELNGHLAKIVHQSDSHMAAIAEALEPLPTENKAVLYYLIRLRLIDAYSIAFAIGDIRILRASDRRTQIMRAKRHPNTKSVAAAISAAACAIGENVPKRVECMIVEIEKSSGLKVSKRTIERALKSMRHLKDDAMSSGR